MIWSADTNVYWFLFRSPSYTLIGLLMKLLK